MFRKPIRKVVAAWVIPEVHFLPKRAGYEREHHPKLAYNKTCKLPRKHILFNIYYSCLSIFCSVRLMCKGVSSLF
jgi:hypothetical protein